jgi:hypothetical protein
VSRWMRMTKPDLLRASPRADSLDPNRRKNLPEAEGIGR